MKLKLVILIDVLEDILAGAERQVYELIKGINRERFDVRLYILHQKQVPEEMKTLDCEVMGLGIKRIYSFNGIWQGFKFANDIKKGKADILMTYHFGSDVWGTVFGKFARAPFIISNRRDEGFWRKKVHTSAYKFVNRWVNNIIVVSDAVKKIVVESENVKSDKIEVIHNGVDVNRFEIICEIPEKMGELKLTLGTPVVGCVGNLRSIKGQRYLVEAAVKVLKRFSDAQFLFVGAGEIKDSLVSQAKKLNIENNIQFLGQRSDIPELLSIMDVCVLPSLSEGLSNTLLEYMAAGKPIISTRVGGNTELITNKEEGLLVDPANSHALAETIISLLDNKELRQRLGQAAKRKVVENYSIQRMIQKYERTLETPFVPKKMKQINICHLISSNGLFGAEKVMLSLAANMNYNGIKSWVIGIKNSYNPHSELIDEAKDKEIPAITIESRGRFDFKSVDKICEFIRQNDISVLHAHNYKANLLGLLAARKTKIPIVTTLHGYIGGGAKLRFYESIDRFILRFFNKVILVDDSLRKWFKNGSPKPSIINNGVSLEVSSCNNTLSKDKKGLVIGSIGRLSPEKGHKYLLEAFSRAIKDYPDLQLIIVGDGELRNELEGLTSSLGVKENVTFTGFQKDVTKYYNSIDIYVSPSLLEHFPLTILEAMGFGKAIVATNVGGTPDLIKKEGFTGLLINPGSSDAIYKAILTYILQPSLRKTYGGNSMQFVKENYSLEKMVDSYKKVYEDTICNS